MLSKKEMWESLLKDLSLFGFIIKETPEGVVIKDGETTVRVDFPKNNEKPFYRVSINGVEVEKSRSIKNVCHLLRGMLLRDFVFTTSYGEPDRKTKKISVALHWKVYEMIEKLAKAGYFATVADACRTLILIGLMRFAESFGIFYNKKD